MSANRVYPLRCPSCNAEFEALLTDSINREQDPELRDRLLANQLNRIACPSCSFSFRVDKNLLYHDPGRKFMVYGFAGGVAQIETAKREFQTLLAALSSDAKDLPALHMTLTRLDMVERIFVLEAGLDARLIEYIKRRVYLNNRAQTNPLRKRLLFDAQNSTDEQLMFVVQDVETGALERAMTYGRETYRALAATFDRDEKTPSLMELFPGPVISARDLPLDSAPPPRM